MKTALILNLNELKDELNALSCDYVCVSPDMTIAYEHHDGIYPVPLVKAKRWTKETATIYAEKYSKHLGTKIVAVSYGRALNAQIQNIEKVLKLLENV